MLAKNRIQFLSMTIVSLLLLFPGGSTGFSIGHIHAATGQYQEPAAGFVKVINQTNRTIRLYASDYVDRLNNKYEMSGYWALPPGANTYLLDNDHKILARKFGFWVADNYGRTPWKIDVANNYSDGNLTLYITDQLLDRHLKIRQQALAGALSKLVAAFVAQGIVTAGDPKQDTIGDLIARGIALAARQSLIESAVVSVFPHFDSDQKAAARRIVGLVLEGRLNLRNYDAASRRDALLARIRQEQPSLTGAADFLDFMDGLHQVYSSKR